MVHQTLCLCWLCNDVKENRKRSPFVIRELLSPSGETQVREITKTSMAHFNCSQVWEIDVN